MARSPPRSPEKATSQADPWGSTKSDADMQQQEDGPADGSPRSVKKLKVEFSDAPFPLPSPLRQRKRSPARVSFSTSDPALEELMSPEEAAVHYLPPQVGERGQLSMHAFMPTKQGTKSGGVAPARARLKQVGATYASEGRTRSRSPLSSDTSEAAIDKKLDVHPGSSESETTQPKVQVGFHVASPVQATA